MQLAVFYFVVGTHSFPSAVGGVPICRSTIYDTEAEHQIKDTHYATDDMRGRVGYVQDVSNIVPFGIRLDLSILWLVARSHFGQFPK
jgi:hypothetical protein